MKLGRKQMAVRGLFLILLWLTVAVQAQAQPRDYAISLPRVAYAADGATATITFAVSNQGGAAIEASQIVISEDRSGRIAANAELPALAAGAAQDFSIALPLAELPAEALSFTIEAGIDQYELAGSPISRNNIQAIIINRADAGAATGGPVSAPSAARYDLWLPLVNLGINFRQGGVQLNDDFYSGSDILLRLALLLVALFCLWLLSLVLRLIFRRPPKFETWQPPYAVNSWHDPDSAPGRRQSWQYHAQSSSISAAPVPDQVAVIKHLTDRRGTVLGGWRVIAVRSVQYDIYGRISRSEVIMPQKLIKALNRVAGRAHELDGAALERALAPIAKGISKRALSAVEKQNASLWLALDMRFDGALDEARILFELYQFRGEAWRRIDQWEPELAPTGARVPEHFSYTLSGQLPGETFREFKGRLVDDIRRLLANLLQPHYDAADAYQPDEPATDHAAAAPDSPVPDDETDAR